MDAIEKRARELLAAAINGVSISTPAMILNPEIPQLGVVSTGDALRAIIAALMLGGSVDLLDQHSAGGVQPEELKVVPPSALGTDEAGSVGIDQVAGGFPRDIELAEVASKHGVGVRPESDHEATADHSARYLVGPADDDGAMVVQVSRDVAEAHSKARIARSFSIAARPEVP